MGGLLLYLYKVTNKHQSENRHIEFFSSLLDGRFISACENTFLKHGFIVEFDGSYLNVVNPNKKSIFSDIYIESDQWGSIWGEASPWATKERNHNGIFLLESLLNNSKEFMAKSV